MHRKLKLTALLLIAALLLTGCVGLPTGEIDPNATPQPTMEPLTAPVFTDRDAVYEWYNEVQIGDTLDDLIARYGEPTIEETNNGSTYYWRNEEGYGFAAVFFSNNVLRSKLVAYEDPRQFKELSAATSLANFASLKTQHDFSMACLALGGKPCEMMVIALDESSSPDTQHLYLWVDEFGSNIWILFNSDEKIQSVSYALADRAE